MWQDPLLLRKGTAHAVYVVKAKIPMATNTLCASKGKTSCRSQAVQLSRKSHGISFNVTSNYPSQLACLPSSPINVCHKASLKSMERGRLRVEGVIVGSAQLLRALEKPSCTRLVVGLAQHPLSHTGLMFLKSNASRAEGQLPAPVVV